MKTLLIEVPDDVYERNVYYWAAARYFPAKAKEAVEVNWGEMDLNNDGRQTYQDEPVKVYAVKENI